MSRVRAPLLILCPPRSFSSVCCAMLGQHPELFGFPELNLFVADTIADIVEYMEATSTSMLLAGTARSIAQLHDGAQTPATVAAAYDWLDERRAWPVERVFNYLLEAIYPRVGIDKSPCTTFPSFLARAMRLYPDAQVLHLTRHPFTAIESLARLIPRGELKTRKTGAALVWLAAHDQLLELESDLRPEKFIRIHGEDVLNDPDTTLERIARWIGVASDRATIDAMKRPELSPFASAGPANAPLGNDPGFLSSPALRSATAGKALASPSLDEDLARSVASTCRRLGYLT